MFGAQTRYALALTALVLAVTPLDADPADAGRVKFRVRSNYGNHFGVRQKYRTSERTEEQTAVRPRLPGAAAAAAERARAALAAEEAARDTAASAGIQALPGSKTVHYESGITCIAGC